MTLEERLDGAVPFDPKDAEVLQSLLSNRTLLSALASVRAEALDMGRQILCLPLESEEGRLKALRLQGMSRGILRALDHLDQLQHKET